MGLHVYGVHHRVHDLAAVGRAADPALARHVAAHPAVRGVLALVTCNRVEVLIDAADNADIGALDRFLAGVLRAEPAPRCFRYADAVTHLFHVAAGLDSMVVGEREIAGQLRRALVVAGTAGRATVLMHRVVDAALRTSRQIAYLTGLASAGRSVVGVGLTMIERLAGPLSAARVLLLGTGSYAGASVAELRARGCLDVSVFSASGRAEEFARGHDLHVVGGADLAWALAAADVVVSCRGVGTPILTRDLLDAGLTGRRARGRIADLPILDLAVIPDVESGVEQLPGVRVIGLAEVQVEVPDAASAQISRALDLIEAGTADLARQLDERRLDPAIVAVRELVDAAVEDEIARLPAAEHLPRAAAERALRRLAARMAHVPTARARRAAGAGTAEEYVAALEKVLGITTSLKETV